LQVCPFPPSFPPSLPPSLPLQELPTTSLGCTAGTPPPSLPPSLPPSFLSTLPLTFSHPPLPSLPPSLPSSFHSLNLNTETGRLSARRPNLQNQPALEKVRPPSLLPSLPPFFPSPLCFSYPPSLPPSLPSSQDQYKIRKAFVSEPNKSLIVADYGQLELRLLAHITKCQSMIKVCCLCVYVFPCVCMSFLPPSLPPCLCMSFLPSFFPPSLASLPPPLLLIVADYGQSARTAFARTHYKVSEYDQGTPCPPSLPPSLPPSVSFHLKSLTSSSLPPPLLYRPSKKGVASTPGRLWVCSTTSEKRWMTGR